MRSGGEKRGNAKERRARKHWLLTQYGTGKICPCFHCNKRLTFKTLTNDRIIAGGSYRRDNVIPSCITCNQQRYHQENAIRRLSEIKDADSAAIWLSAA